MLHAKPHQLAHMLINQTIVDDAANLAHGDNFMVAKNAQLMRDGGIVAPHATGKVANTKLAGWR